MIHPPPSHHCCILSPSLPAPHALLQSLHLGALMLGVSVFPRVLEFGAEAEQELGTAGGVMDPGHWVPEAEQGLWRVRPILGELGSALLSTWMLGCNQGAHPNGCPSPNRPLVLPGGWKEGDGGEAVKWGHRQSWGAPFQGFMLKEDSKPAL